MTVRPARPLARAVRTKSEPSTESIDARVMRATGASEKIPSVSAGRMSCLRLAMKVSPSPAMRLSIR
jgi:hypothetical protein